MTYLMEFGNGIIISIILNMLVNSISNIISKDLSSNDQLQQKFIIVFISGLVFLFLAYTVFNTDGKYSNKSIKYGFLLSGIILLVNIIFINWHLLNEHTRLLFIIISLILIFKHSLKYNSDDE